MRTGMSWRLIQNSDDAGISDDNRSFPIRSKPDWRRRGRGKENNYHQHRNNFKTVHSTTTTMTTPSPTPVTELSPAEPFSRLLAMRVRCRGRIY
ncbi:hypothetical protein PoB_003668300 [Plakobranchus ocellatus]|uniref:Uncharacterized protein n=1 Tax=Plakobranchus ocellatus TaxID=259542 RepID=A0AAV4AS36_9GAST|nr:hypothetical protein PoB_003668300 [Plakobranchus ocellatus]